MTIIETVLDRPFIHEPGSDPHLRAGPIAVYISGHDFDDGDIESPSGVPVALKTAYPHLIDIRDIGRDLERQQETARRVFAAIKADRRISAICVDDMQHVLDMSAQGPGPAS